MARYGVQHNRTASATLPVGNLIGIATRRFKLYELIIGSEAAAADGSFLWTVNRWSTAAGTPGSSPLAQPLDFADPAAAVTTGEAHSVTPTPVANSEMLAIGLNQRATFRWVCAPGSEISSPATATTGIMWNTPTAALVAVSATALFEE